MKPGKEQIKRIRKLYRKKYRRETGLFVVERWKIIRLFLEAGYRPEQIWAVRPPEFPADVAWTQVDARTLAAMSDLQHPYDALAVFRMPQPEPFRPRGLVPVLDGIQDPGNLGTIIRTADWFGLDQILCSPDSVDAFNPKVIQASMGSLARVKVFYGPLEQWLEANEMPVFGASAGGDNLFETRLPGTMFLVLGNEGHGIGAGLQKYISQHLAIPKAARAAAESLNVAQAAGIFMAEWYRQQRFT